MLLEAVVGMAPLHRDLSVSFALSTARLDKEFIDVIKNHAALNDRMLEHDDGDMDSDSSLVLLRDGAEKIQTM